MNMRSFLYYIAAVLPISMDASADTQVVAGQITTYHMNAGIPDRVACVTMSPALPETPYLCLWKTNSLYKEFNATLLAAYAAGKSCSVWLDQKDNAGGYWMLNIITCNQ